MCFIWCFDRECWTSSSCSSSSFKTNRLRTSFPRWLTYIFTRPRNSWETSERSWCTYFLAVIRSKSLSWMRVLNELWFFFFLFVCVLRVDRELLDYKKIGIHLNQLIGSSSSIGAHRVRNVCVVFHAISQQNSRPGWVVPSLCIIFSFTKITWRKTNTFL